MGTSGYSYDDWVGPFYEPGTAKRDFLSVYSRNFSFTELNFSYYKMPTASTLASIGDRVPEGFRFSVKAHGSLTHERDRSALASNAQAFTAGVEPLRRAGKLSAVLAQFPYSFHYTVENRHYLDQLIKAMGALPLVVEFRNDEWHIPQVQEGLERRGVSLVIPDLPPLERLPRHDPGSEHLPVPGPIAYVRFHGRNSKAWWTGDNVSRYDYNYTEAELRPWASAVETLLQRADLVIIAFNNHANAQALFNAKLFLSLLQERPDAETDGGNGAATDPGTGPDADPDTAADSTDGEE